MLDESYTTPPKSVADAFKEIAREKPPIAQKDSVYKELRAQQKAIRAAIAAGWTASQLAARLRKSGVKASEERLRTEIRMIAGLKPHVRDKKQSPTETD